MSDSLADTIKPKSDQLNADDLLVGPITVTVTAVTRGPADQPVHLSLDGGYMPYKPCKSMRRCLISAWGDKGTEWVGRSMTLFCDPFVKFGGVALGGIRISHLSHLDVTMNLMLTQSRGRKSQFTINPLIIDQKEQPKNLFGYDDLAKEWVDAATKDPDILGQIDNVEYRNFIKSKIGYKNDEK